MPRPNKSPGEQCSRCNEPGNVVRFDSIQPTVDGDKVIEAHLWGVCQSCYLEQFAEVYPGETLPDLTPPPPVPATTVPCTRCDRGNFVQFASLQPKVEGDQTIPPHLWSVCSPCYLEQFAEVYPSEPVPELQPA